VPLNALTFRAVARLDEANWKSSSASFTSSRIAVSSSTTRIRGFVSA